MTSAKPLRAQLISAAKGSVLLRLVAMVLSLATAVVLARALGPAEYGTYAYVFALVTLLALPAQVGIPTLLVRETARAHAQKEWSNLKTLWRWATRTILGTSLAITAILALILWGSSDHATNTWRTAVSAVLLIPLIALGNARGAALRGLRRIVSGQLPEAILRPGFFLLFISAAWMAGLKLTAATAMSWHVLAAACGFLIGAIILFKARPNEMINAQLDHGCTSGWLKAAVPLAAIGGLQTVGNQTGIVLLGLMGTHAEVAMYKVAASAATLAVFGLQTANSVVGPHFAGQFALGDTRRIQRLAAAGAIASSALTIPVVAAFVLCGPWLLHMVYGEGYEGAYGPLLILCAGQMVNALFGSVGLLLNMTGYERIAARWLAIAAICNILGGVVLIPRFGMYGAAIAACASVVIWNVAYWWMARKLLGVDGSVLAVCRRILRS